MLEPFYYPATELFICQHIIKKLKIQIAIMEEIFSLFYPASMYLIYKEFKTSAIGMIKCPHFGRSMQLISVMMKKVV
jgi:hypothetical protein